jgi:hypothetical protein
MNFITENRLTGIIGAIVKNGKTFPIRKRFRTSV